MTPAPITPNPRPKLTERFAPVLALALAAAALLAASAGAETFENGSLVVSLEGKATPRALPRDGTAPIAVTMSAGLSTSDGSQPPALSRVTVAINRFGKLSYRGLPTCPRERIDVATSAQALHRCRGALVGHGRLTAQVLSPQEAPFPAHGRVLAFNGRIGRRPVIFAQIYGKTRVEQADGGTAVVPTSYLLPISVRRTRGTFGIELTARLPYVSGDWGYVTGFALTLRRSYAFRGRPRAYLSAGCPAPAGFPRATFPFVRADYSFSDGRELNSTLVRTCRAKG
jgi:hypothetical protein